MGHLWAVGLPGQAGSSLPWGCPDVMRIKGGFEDGGAQVGAREWGSVDRGQLSASLWAPQSAPEPAGKHANS